MRPYPYPYQSTYIQRYPYGIPYGPGYGLPYGRVRTTIRTVVRTLRTSAQPTTAPIPPSRNRYSGARRSAHLKRPECALGGINRGLGRAGIDRYTGILNSEFLKIFIF